MTCAIFIRTFPGDADYHEKCMASIEKFCTGFSEVVVRCREDVSPKAGYLAQQVDKCHADDFTKADFILITDSDTLFTRPVTPETFLRDGKAIWLHTPWTDEMLAHPGTRAWRDVMQRFSGAVPPSEFMRRQPFMIPRWLLKSLRKWCFERHRLTLGEYVTREGMFSEFNVIGHHAWQHHHDELAWVDTSTDELPELVVRQFWSRDAIEKNMDEINQILA